MKFFPLAILLILLQNISVIVCVIHLTLNGKDWRATNQNQSIRVSARVPGSIFTDLMRNNILKEDPYYGYNDIVYKWVSHDNWTYQKSFNVDEKLLTFRGIYLVCHGLDTVSRIYLNDNEIGTTDNMFIRYKFDIKKYLKAGDNILKVSFESAITYAKSKHDEQVSKSYIIPPECTASVQKGECHANYIRKMQASFSWDWGPSFPTQGIWQNIEIETYNTSMIRDVIVDTFLENNRWILNTTVYIESVSNQTFEAKLQFLIYNNIISTNNYNFTPLSDGTVSVSLRIPINESIVIDPWYPNGVGTETQMLYQLTVSLMTHEESANKSVKIGFRTIELIQDKLQSNNGLTFYFKVNGLPFFVKGSNWIPAHVFPELLTKEYIRKLLQSARDANMNMLRVWGGGIYESDYFYEVADELGIMIWQDFMFACALYPTNDEFLNIVTREAIQQIRRLQHHPSIALWAGNNENEAAIAQYWWPEIITRKASYDKDYLKLYVDTIRVITESEDTSRPFVSSSPSNGLETIKEGWLASDPQDTRYGDVHYYNYGTDAWNWKIYPSAKFASEYGFQSYPSLQTFSSAINASDWTYPISGAVAHRQHHGNGDREMVDLIQNYLKLPVNGGYERFEDIIYLSQIAQAMSIKTETEFYRRNRDINAQTGDGFTMGALYWQLNDIWQAPTWASIEFGGKWKLLHYFAKHMFANLLVSPFEDNTEVLKVAVVRDDYLGSIDFNMSISVYKWSSLQPVKQIKKTITTTNFSSKIFYENSIASVLQSSGCESREQCLLEVSVENVQNEMNATNFMFLSPLKSADGIVKPHLLVSNVTGPYNSPPNYIYDITIETNAVSPFVWLDFQLNSNIRGAFSDNGFIMLRNKKLVKFYGETPVSIQDFIANIYVKSLTDVKS